MLGFLTNRDSPVGAMAQCEGVESGANTHCKNPSTENAPQDRRQSIVTLLQLHLVLRAADTVHIQAHPVIPHETSCAASRHLSGHYPREEKSVMLQTVRDRQSSPCRKGDAPRPAICAKACYIAKWSRTTCSRGYHTCNRVREEHQYPY